MARDFLDALRVVSTAAAQWQRQQAAQPGARSSSIALPATRPPGDDRQQCRSLSRLAAARARPDALRRNAVRPDSRQLVKRRRRGALVSQAGPRITYRGHSQSSSRPGRRASPSADRYDSAGGNGRTWSGGRVSQQVKRQACAGHTAGAALGCEVGHWHLGARPRYCAAWLKPDTGKQVPSPKRSMATGCRAAIGPSAMRSPPALVISRACEPRPRGGETAHALGAYPDVPALPAERIRTWQAGTCPLLRARLHGQCPGRFGGSHQACQQGREQALETDSATPATVTAACITGFRGHRPAHRCHHAAHRLVRWATCQPQVARSWSRAAAPKPVASDDCGFVAAKHRHDDPPARGLDAWEGLMGRGRRLQSEQLC